MDAQRYPISLRILHWLMAVLILGMIAGGWVMKELSGKDPLRADLYGLHKSFGVILLALIVLRIVVRTLTRIPPLPQGLSAMEKRGAKAGHLLLYAGMVAVPLSGFVMSMAGGHGIKFFGMPLPNLMELNRKLSHFAHEWHELLPYVLLGVIALHLAGALKHRFADDAANDVLPRMGIRPR